MPEAARGRQEQDFIGVYPRFDGRRQNGEIDPVIGRDKEIRRVIQILSRRSKNNPCLIGEPGVGKTAIAEGLARKIAAGDVPEKLLDKNCCLWTSPAWWPAPNIGANLRTALRR